MSVETHNEGLSDFFKKNPYQVALDKIFAREKEYNKLLRKKFFAQAFGNDHQIHAILTKLRKFTNEDLELFILAKTIQKHPEMFKDEVPARLAHYFSDKLNNTNKNVGIFEHLKTFEEYNLYDIYLENSNEVKEILSHYNLKYELIDDNPILKIIFPYAEGMYGHRYVDVEYKLIESFLKELLRYEFVYKVDETDETTTVLIECGQS